MNRPKIKRHQTESPIKEVLDKAKQRSAASLSSDDCMLVSFKHLDQTQGDTLKEWEQYEMLSPAIETLHGYSSRSIITQATSSKFTIYGGFPPSDKTEFTHPRHIPEDAEWARIHVNGKQCIIGHIVRPNTFYIVFLDGDHKFWISTLKNT